MVISAVADAATQTLHTAKDCLSAFDKPDKSHEIKIVTA